MGCCLYIFIPKSVYLSSCCQTKTSRFLLDFSWISAGLLPRPCLKPPSNSFSSGPSFCIEQSKKSAENALKKREWWGSKTFRQCPYLGSIGPESDSVYKLWCLFVVRCEFMFVHLARTRNHVDWRLLVKERIPKIVKLSRGFQCPVRWIQTHFVLWTCLFTQVV